EVELELTRPYALPTGAGPRVPDDASSISPDGPTSTSVAGFGAGLSELRAQGGGIGRAPGDIGSDLVEHPSPTLKGGGIGRQGGGIGRAPGDIGADLVEHPSPTLKGGGIGRQGGDIGADQGQRAPHHAARVEAGRGTRQRVLEQITYAGTGVSNAELARILGI